MTDHLRYYVLSSTREDILCPREAADISTAVTAVRLTPSEETKTKVKTKDLLLFKLANDDVVVVTL